MESVSSRGRSVSRRSGNNDSHNMDNHEYRELLKRFLEEQEIIKITKRKVFALERAYIEIVAKCERCGRTEWLTYDHLVPRELLMQLGVEVETEYDPENSQCLCRVCNQYKSHRLDFTNPKTKQVLLKYLNRL